MNLDKETLAFNVFRNLHGDLPPGEKSESPDFLINLDNKIIGVELTELMEEDSGPSSLAAKYSLEDKIAKSSRIKFDLASNKRIMANLHIRDNLSLPSNKIHSISKEIADLITRTTENYPNTLSYNYEINENLPKEILAIYFDIAPFMTESHFSVMRGKWTGSFNINDLNRAIEKKDKNIPKYRKKADSIYLVIIEGFAPNSWFGPFIKTGTYIKNSFDKIFLLKIMSRELFQIK